MPSNVRWVASSLRYNQDNEILQNIIVYPEGDKKEQVKAEHGRNHSRVLLIPNEDSYVISR